MLSQLLPHLQVRVPGIQPIEHVEHERIQLHPSAGLFVRGQVLVVPVGTRQQLERQLEPLLVPTAGHEELGHEIPGRSAQQRPKRGQVDPPRTPSGRTGAPRHGMLRGGAYDEFVHPGHRRHATVWIASRGPRPGEACGPDSRGQPTPPEVRFAASGWSAKYASNRAPAAWSSASCTML